MWYSAKSVLWVGAIAMLFWVVGMLVSWNATAPWSFLGSVVWGGALITVAIVVFRIGFLSTDQNRRRGGTDD